MQEEVVRHDHGAEHAHQDRQGARRNLRLRQTDPGRAPMDVHQCQFVDERQADQRHEPDDPLFDLAVGIGGQNGAHHGHGQEGARHQRDAEQHLQRDRRPQNLRQGRGDRRAHGRQQNRAGRPRLQMPGGGFRKAIPRRDAHFPNMACRLPQRGPSGYVRTADTSEPQSPNAAKTPPRGVSRRRQGADSEATTPCRP